MILFDKCYICNKKLFSRKGLYTYSYQCSSRYCGFNLYFEGNKLASIYLLINNIDIQYYFDLNKIIFIYINAMMINNYNKLIDPYILIENLAFQ